MKIANPLPIVNTANTPATTDDRQASILKSSKEMESVFLSIVMKSMQKTLGEGALGSSQNNLASMLFSNVMGDAFARGGGIGLAEKIADGLTEAEIKHFDEAKPEINPLIYQSIKLDSK